jgi:hypothetical protein
MVHPVLSGGYVLDGGALCMELMTPQVVRHALELIKLAGSLRLGACDITGSRRFEAHDTRESLRFEPDHDVTGFVTFLSS